ncbi:MAG: DUF3784 domain-containing protein [Solibacillus sp.]
MILIGIALLMILLGILMQTGKGGFLISGYNTMPKEQQAQVDIKGLSKMMAFYAYFLALVFFGMVVCEWLNWSNGIIVCVVILLISTVVVIFKSQKFYEQVTYTGTGKFGKGAKWSGIISIVVVVGVGILLYFSMQPTAITVTDDELTIGGMYGDTFALADVSELALIEEMPAISMRTNGSALGSKLKGHFKLENGDKVKLFIDKSKPPFITFIAGGKRYYVNETTSEKTTALFEQIK